MAPQVIMDGKRAAERPTYQLLSWSLNALLNNVNNKLMIVPENCYMFNFLETSSIMTMQEKRSYFSCTVVCILVQMWYFVTKIVLTYCEKKMF